MKAALAKAQSGRDTAEHEESEVAEDAPAPKASSSKSTESPANSTDGTPESTSGSGEEPATARVAPQPRYDSPSFDKWVTNNPEKAAELFSKRFKGQIKNPEEWKSQFIALENKRKRHHDANETQLTAIQTERAEVETLRTETLAMVQPHIDSAAALEQQDAAAFERAFQAAYGQSFRDVSKWLLRANSQTPGSVQPIHLAKLTEQERKIQELEAKLAEKDKAPAPKTKAEPEPKAAPPVSAKWIDSEVDAEHGVRDLSDWAKKVEEKYQDSYDDEAEDFAMSIEDAADEVLREFLEKRSGKTAPPPKKKRPVRRPPRADDEDRTPTRDLEEAEESGARDVPWDQRVRNALKKAERRAG